jgi:thiol-disulfide isomerase/thioredoxin
MKKTILTLTAAATLFACTPTDSYKISGEYKNVPTDSKIYLAELTTDNIVYLDSAEVNNGSFSFAGTQSAPAVRFLFYSLPTGGDDIIPIVLENGSIKVRIDDKATVTGTELNNAMQQYKSDFDAITGRAETLFMQAGEPENQTPAKRDSLQALTDALSKELSATITTHIKKNIKNPIGAFLISTTGQMCDPEEIYNVVDSVPEAYRDERFKRFCKQFKESLITKNGALNTQVGNSYINFELKNPEGNKILFSDIVEKNKYTLLDFWASWCGPCRKAMPQIKEIYEKYGKKGLAVVSLSLDTDGEAWKKAIDELGMTWTQLCNPDGGSREVGQAYGIEFIPTMLIISQDGKIAARGLQGEALAKKIEELMK